MTRCNCKCEIYSRVCGYFRPVANWHKGKKEEFKDRLNYDMPEFKVDNMRDSAEKKIA